MERQREIERDEDDGTQNLIRPITDEKKINRTQKKKIEKKKKNEIRKMSVYCVHCCQKMRPNERHGQNSRHAHEFIGQRIYEHSQQIFVRSWFCTLHIVRMAEQT